MKKRECVRASLLFAPSVVARLVASIIPTYAIVPWRRPGDGGWHFGIGLVHQLCHDTPHELFSVSRSYKYVRKIIIFLQQLLFLFFWFFFRYHCYHLTVFHGVFRSFLFTSQCFAFCSGVNFTTEISIPFSAMYFSIFFFSRYLSLEALFLSKYSLSSRLLLYYNIAYCTMPVVHGFPLLSYLQVSSFHY